MFGDKVSPREWKVVFLPAQKLSDAILWYYQDIFLNRKRRHIVGFELTSTNKKTETQVDEAIQPYLIFESIF